VVDIDVFFLLRKFESDVTIRLLVIKMASQNERMMELLVGRQEGGGGVGGETTQETTNPPTEVDVASSAAKATNEMRPSSPTNVGNTGNTTTNTITFGNNVNFSSTSGLAVGSNNVINQW
jgi:hypothetical protein